MTDVIKNKAMRMAYDTLVDMRSTGWVDLRAVEDVLSALNIAMKREPVDEQVLNQQVSYFLAQEDN
jgi:hypothetical protein